MNAYWINGALPTKQHSHCQVDELPFEQHQPGLIAESVEDRELLTAWSALGEVVRSM